MPVHLTIAIAFTVLVASFSFYFVERPFLRLKDKPLSVHLKGVFARNPALDKLEAQ